jgi:hypothetical protein
MNSKDNRNGIKQHVIGNRGRLQRARNLGVPIAAGSNIY